MTRRIVRTENAPSSANYSQAVVAGGLVFVSGQGPFDPSSGTVVGDTIEDQVRQCLANVAAILAAAGSSLDRVVSSTFILDDPNDFAGLNAEWVRHFPGERPARQGAHPPFDRMIPGMKVSIAVIAEVDPSPPAPG